MTTDLWDYESRFETTTRTGDGAFDQIIALSQGIINENFQKLYVMYSELHEVHFKEPGIGTLDGTLLAPQVLIPSGENASNYSRVLFLLRYALAQGFVQPDSDSDYDFLDLRLVISRTLEANSIYLT